MLNLLHTLLPENLDRTATTVLAAYVAATSMGSLGTGIVVGWVWRRR